jgi:catechol 2,3-dioxygenase-like lactoylglutathione lyase family enzyme
MKVCADILVGHSLPMPRRFDHIDLRVPNLAEVSHFYRKLLPALGFKNELPVSGWLQYYAEGDEATEFFGVTESAAHAPNENRIAFWASNRTEVDDLAVLLHAIGAKNIEGPEYYESPDYYAVFFEDPAGNRLEICYRSKN